jgi:hypothetical protein
MNLRALIGTYWEAQRGDGTPFREFATRKQALEYMREFRRLDATGAGRRVVKVTRYAGRGFSQADVEAAVEAERARCLRIAHNIEGDDAGWVIAAILEGGEGDDR